MSRKVCIFCNKKKPLGAFPPSRRTAEGRRSYCLDCKIRKDRKGVFEPAEGEESLAGSEVVAAFAKFKEAKGLGWEEVAYRCGVDRHFFTIPPRRVGRSHVEKMVKMLNGVPVVAPEQIRDRLATRVRMPDGSLW